MLRSAFLGVKFRLHGIAHGATASGRRAFVPPPGTTIGGSGFASVGAESVRGFEQGR
jgi:hypothetical protein